MLSELRLVLPSAHLVSASVEVGRVGAGRAGGRTTAAEAAPAPAKKGGGAERFDGREESPSEWGAS